VTRKLGWLELDHVPVDELLAGILEGHGDARPYHRLDLPQPPVRPGWMADEVTGGEPGISGFFGHGGVKFP